MVGLQPSMPAPDYSCKAVWNGDFVDITPARFQGKYVVLFFYPMDFTFVCPTEIISFADRAEEFRQIDCELIAASCDSVYAHYAWVNTPRKTGGLGDVEIPLLADKSGRVARAYGVYNEETGIPYRGLFIIDGNGIIRQITINDLPVGRNVDETFRLLQAFKFTDVNGEVCPANWRPGKKTIKPNPKDSINYFEQVQEKTK